MRSWLELSDRREQPTMSLSGASREVALGMAARADPRMLHLVSGYAGRFERQTVGTPEIEIRTRLSWLDRFREAFDAARPPGVDYLVADLITARADRRAKSDDQIRGPRPEFRAHRRDNRSCDIAHGTSPTRVGKANCVLHRIIDQHRHAVSRVDDEWQAGRSRDQGIRLWDSVFDFERAAAAMPVINDLHTRAVSLPARNERSPVDSNPISPNATVRNGVGAGQATGDVDIAIARQPWIARRYGMYQRKAIEAIESKERRIANRCLHAPATPHVPRRR